MSQLSSTLTIGPTAYTRLIERAQVQQRSVDEVLLELLSRSEPDNLNGQNGKAQQEALHHAMEDSEMRYRALFEQSNDAVFILDLNGRHIEVNHRAGEMLGYTPQEIIGLSYRDIVATRELDEARNILGQLMHGETVVPYERAFRHKDGHIVHVEVNVELVRNSAGEPMHIQSVVRDISARKEAELALRQSEARQRGMIQAIPDLIFRNHRDGTFLDYHAPNPDLLAASPQEFMAKTIEEVLPAPLGSALMNLLAEALETGQVRQHEYELPIHGSVHRFEIRLVPTGDDEVLSITRDVTDQWRMRRREFELALERERVRLLSEFIENSSHEFRTPLTIINMSAHFIALSHDPEQQRSNATRIEEQVQRITRLVDMLLTVSKLERRDALKAGPVNLNVIGAALCSHARVRHGNKPQLIWEEQPGLPDLRGDSEYLMLALNQLLDNAYRYTSQDGQITVKTGIEDGEPWIEVGDTGRGISETVLPHIFETFWREDEAHTTPGFGLGLPIVRRIAELHQGRVSVSSRPGRGSRFRITLPMASPAHHEQPCDWA